MTVRIAPAGALLVLAALLAACGDDAGAEPTSVSEGDYPLTVQNCGADVTIERAPERTVLLTSSPVPFLHALGVMDRVVSRAGAYPAEYYDDETLAEIEDVDLLTDQLDSSGHLQISKEVVIGQEPDVVLGQVDNLSRESLEAVGIPQLVEPALCEEGIDDPGFDDVYAQMEFYGRVYGRPDQAADAVAELKERTAAAEALADTSGRTAAVLYPTVGGGVTYAYGNQSMADPQLEAAGFENVFGDVDERVFEVSLEELLGRDPDVLVLLHSDGDPADVEQALEDLPGADRLTAVTNGDVMTQLFNFTEPPTPLSVDGLERIVERFAS
ncbi:ABC transporter substrate-binding protein [Nocardioides sp. C4-1]|uniref:ABC transporter substrate-binding protein n=1 Tax=Nocardioides sp. C4-1 TaxID=3151851 RepID=UPI0032647B65